MYTSGGVGGGCSRKSLYLGEGVTVTQVEEEGNYGEREGDNWKIRSVGSLLFSENYNNNSLGEDFFFLVF